MGTNSAAILNFGLPAGPNGDVGAQGPIGLQGPKGDAGMQGLKGDTGNQGTMGLQGVKGDQGDVGPVGPAGSIGPKGDTGNVEPTGSAGTGLKIVDATGSVVLGGVYHYKDKLFLHGSI